MIRTFAVAFIVFLAIGCSKKENEAPAAPPVGPSPPGETEISRGKTACENYAKRLCECAVGNPKLKTECDLARARPEALNLAVDVALQEANNKSPDKDKWAAYQNARAIMKSCLQDDMNLRC